MRLLAFICVAFALLAPFVASFGVLLPFAFSAEVYFAVFAGAGLLFALLSRVLELAGRKLKVICPRLARQKIGGFGVLSIVVIFWAIITASRGEYMALAFAAFFFALVLAVRHEYEWLRLARFFLFVAALSSWLMLMGQDGKRLLEMYLPIFVVAFFMAVILLARRKERRLARWGYGVFAIWLVIVMALMIIPDLQVSGDVFSKLEGSFPVARELTSREALFGSAEAQPLVFGIILAKWIAVFATLIKAYFRKEAAGFWVAGLIGAFAGIFWADFLLNGWFGYGMMFFFLAGLAEWAAHSRSRS